MRGGVAEIHVRQDTLLLARFGTFSRLPRELYDRGRARAFLPRLLAIPTAMIQLREYCAAQLSIPKLVEKSDYQVVMIAEDAIQSGRLQAVVFRRMAPVQTGAPASLGRAASAKPINPGKPPIPSAPKSLTSGAAPVGSSLPGAPTAPTVTRSVAQWSTEDRIAEVIRRAVPKVPGDVGATLLSLLSPESLAIIAGTIAISAAANLTPYGWVADGIIVGVAFGFGGLAAIHALGDLVECFRRTAGAKSSQDLDAAADALARAVVGLGVVGLMIVLHRVAARRGGGGSSERLNAEGAGKQLTDGESPTIRDERFRSSQQSSRADQESAPKPRPKKLREKYLGRTPGKSSRTGREVIARMEKEGKIRTDPDTGAKEFQAKDEQWYDLSEADMAHKTDAVTWWNNVGRSYGAKSPEVRTWMLDSNNYELERFSINRSAGATLGQTQQYLPPLR